MKINHNNNRRNTMFLQSISLDCDMFVGNIEMPIETIEEGGHTITCSGGSACGSCRPPHCY